MKQKDKIKTIQDLLEYNYKRGLVEQIITDPQARIEAMNRPIVAYWNDGKAKQL